MAKKETKEKVQDEVVAEATIETTEKPVKETPINEISLKEKDPVAFLKDFNWHNYQEGIDPIDDGKLEEFEKFDSEYTSMNKEVKNNNSYNPVKDDENILARMFKGRTDRY